MMKPISSLINLDRAMEICFSHTKEIQETEKINLPEAFGRVAGEDILSEIEVPSFTRATMDGYAVMSRDTFGAGKFRPKKLMLLEKIHAGQIPVMKIESEKCSQIATGAMMPEGADAVVKVENTEIEDELILIYDPVCPGTNICPAGEDVKRGDLILHKGDFLSPAKIGVLAALGTENIKVYKKPGVAIIPTGNEVKPPGKGLKPGQVYDVNSYTLYSILKLHGAEPLIHNEIIEDNLEKIEEVIKFYQDAHIIIFSGGSSVGEKDIIVKAIKNQGELLFHGIAIKPGKPTLLGKIGEKLIFGMPGNPTSCLSNAYIMLIPVIRKMGSLPMDMIKKIKLPISRRIVSELGRHQILTVKIENDTVYPAFKSSSSITSMSNADGYIEIPALVDLLEKGDLVEVFLF